MLNCVVSICQPNFDVFHFWLMNKVSSKYILSIAELLRSSYKELLKNDPLRMAGATAFFTTFALPPILVIFIQLFKLILEPKMARKELFKSLSDIVGNETVGQLAGVLNAFRKIAQNWYISIGGFIFLIFVATTLFNIIKHSLNQVWKECICYWFYSSIKNEIRRS